MSAEPLRIVVLVYVVRGPIGGLTWHHLQYAMGLQQLGHDVWIIEQSEDYPDCYDPTTFEMTTDPSYGMDYAGRVFARADLVERWAYHDAHAGVWRGPAVDKVDTVIATADLVLNVSGVNSLDHGLDAVPRRALIDTDPGFTQVRHLTDPSSHRVAQLHTHHFTFAESVASDATLPDDGLAWRPTRQPVVLDAWPVTPPNPAAPFTTVMQWDSYPAFDHDGRTFGMKSQSFEEFMLLPSVSKESLELAVGSPSAPRARLAESGWRVRDPSAISHDPWTFQRYLRASKGEFSVAKHGYVITRSGWFSERSAGYLASGRPVITQETGFSEHLPIGGGLRAFTTFDEALEAIAEVANDIVGHGADARRIALECFDSRVVLRSVLDRCSEGM